MSDSIYAIMEYRRDRLGPTATFLVHQGIEEEIQRAASKLDANLDIDRIEIWKDGRKFKTIRGARG